MPFLCQVKLEGPSVKGDVENRHFPRQMSLRKVGIRAEDLETFLISPNGVRL